MNDSVHYRLQQIVSQLQSHKTLASDTVLDDGIINSPFKPCIIPDNISLHQFLFNCWSNNQYDQLNALTDAITGKTYTYSQLRQHIIWTSNALHSIGVKRNTVVAVYSSNHIDYQSIVYGCSILGAIAALINPAYTGNELLHHIKDSTATYLFTQSAQIDKVRNIQSHIKHLQYICTFDDNSHQLPTYQQLLAHGKTLGNDMIGECKYNPREQVAILPYSSGMTKLRNLLSYISINTSGNIKLLYRYHWSCKRCNVNPL